MNLKQIVGPLSWAFVIIIGGLMITPEGITPIVTNPVLRVVVGVVAVALGVAGFISQRAAKGQARG